MYDKYLSNRFARYLAKFEARCLKEGATSTVYDIFHDLYDDDLWNILLTREYSNYPAIKEVLPDLPSNDLQRAWCGSCGVELSFHSLEFYKKVKEILAKINGKRLSSAKILDFGCGWGRIIRYFSKDTPEEFLYGCDPDERTLRMCLDLKVPGEIRRSDYRPKQLPFGEKFDLIYAYSVFTHLSEKTHWDCLQAIHNSLTSNGIVVLTIRPKSFIEVKGEIFATLPDKVTHAMAQRFDKEQFVFYAHNLPPVDGDITYGDAVIPYTYIKKQWSRMFDLIGPVAFNSDRYQIPIVLRRR